MSNSETFTTVPGAARLASPGYASQMSPRSRSTVIMLVIASFVVSGAVMATEGSILAAMALVIVTLVAGVTVYRLDWGFYIFIGCVLLLDQFGVPGFDPITFRIAYFENLKASYLPNVGAAVVNPLELHLALILLVWVAKIVLKKDVVYQRIPVWFSAIIFFIAITLSFVGGLGKGGTLLPALWEVRALYYLAIIFFLTPQIIRTKEQITAVMWVCMGTIAVKAIQGIWRFVELGFSFGGIPALTAHEDAAFFVTMMIFLLALTLFGGNKKQHRTMLWLLPIIMFGFIVAQRRAAFGSMGATLITMFILITKENRRLLLKIIVPCVIALGMYVAAFWNSDSGLGKPAQLIKASFSNDREITGEDKYWSNFYRVVERYNLAVTIRNSPLIGVGFGNKYDMPIELIDIGFTLRDYIPHNEILWLYAKMGAIGFFCFWLFFNSFVYQGAAIFSQLRDPYLRAVCAVIITAVINQIFVSYFDLQLTFHRNMIYLGVLMGMLPAVDALNKRRIAETTPAPEPTEQQSRARAHG